MPASYIIDFEKAVNFSKLLLSRELSSNRPQQNSRSARLHLAVAGVDDVQDAINRETRLRNVCGYNCLARALRRGLEDFGLQCYNRFSI